MATKHLFANNATTTVASLSGTAGTTLAVTSSAGFPAPGAAQDFLCTLQRQSDNAIEIVAVTAVSGTNWTVVRAQEGTVGLVFVAGDRVELRVTARGLSSMIQLGGATAEQALDNPLALPPATASGHALQASQFQNAVPLILELANIITSGSYVLFDLALRDTRSMWNSSTKAISVPSGFGTITVNVSLSNSGASPITTTIFLLTSFNQRARQSVTVPAGGVANVCLTYTGSLLGSLQVQSSVAFSTTGVRVENDGLTNLGLSLYQV